MSSVDTSKIAKHLRATGGDFKVTGEKIGRDAKYVRKRVARNKALQKVMATQLAQHVCEAEAKLLQAVRDGKISAMLHLLRHPAQGADAKKEKERMKKAKAADAEAPRAVDLSRLSDEELKLLDEILSKAQVTAEASRRAPARRTKRTR